MTADERRALEILEDRIRILLPEEYQDSYESVQPVSMGSASLKYGTDGRVAWDVMWESFCDLAMAGGPPHKGTLLEPASLAEIDAALPRYAEVVSEICRGINLAADVAAKPSPLAGWIRVDCFSDAMAGWLLRAIVMENVAVRRNGLMLFLPAGPGFRVEKEIKNVITVIAKTSHYWLGHTPRHQREAIANLFAEMERESPLVEPALGSAGPAESLDHTSAAMAASILQRTGLRASGHCSVNWLGLECPSVRAAVWLMRSLVGCNVLSRREGTALFVPVNPVTDPDGAAVVRSLARVHSFAVAKHVL